MSPPGDGILGILRLPPSARLHRPFPATLSVQNRHPSRTADLVLQTESADAFIVAGPRTLRLPTLLPGTSVDVRLNVVPLMAGTTCRLPSFKVLDRRQRGPAAQPPPAGAESREEAVTLEAVQVIDERSDARDEEGADLSIHVPSAADPRQLEPRRGGITMLVLPDL